MRVRVFILLDPERFVLFLQLDGNQYVRRFEIRIGLLFVGVILLFDVAPGEVGDLLNKPALLVHNGYIFAGFVLDHNGRDAVGLRHPEVVGTESRRGVHHPRTILRRDEIAQNDPERIALRLDIRHQLFVLDTLEVFSFKFGNDGPGNYFIVRQIRIKHRTIGVILPSFFVEPSTEQRLGQHYVDRFVCVLIERFNEYVVNVFSNGQRRVGR